MMLSDTNTETRHLKANNYNVSYALMDACKEIDALRAELTAALKERASYGDKVTETIGRLEAELATLRAATCEWHYEDDPDDCYWEGACGAAWCLEDGVPTSNEMVYCPKCGKRVVEVPYVEDTEDEEE
jgi:predicted  nucleic acid-binding Zn-ribbon protein